MHIVHQDLAKGGHLLVNIRKFLKTSHRSLRHAVNSHVMDAETAELLRHKVLNGATVLFAGAPGAGKTTLLTSTANELAPTTRLVCAEEVFETDLTLANVAYMQTRPQRSDRSAVTLRELTTAFLRMSPDAIIVGEVRDREVMPFLMALSSGVQGFSSIHARSARHALERVRFLAQLSGVEVHEGALTQLISESIDLVVHLARGPEGPKVTEMISVEPAQLNRDRWSFSTSTLFHRPLQSNSPSPQSAHISRHSHESSSSKKVHNESPLSPSPLHQSSSFSTPQGQESW
jgi:pilus assembly protein CpaF